MAQIEKNFVVDVVGENTGTRWYGSFTVKVLLSHRDHLVRDRRRRELLGETGGSPDARAASSAAIFSELYVRILKSPTWWNESDGGIDLEDDAPVGKVYDETMKAAREHAEAQEKAASDLKAELRKTETPPDAPPAV